LLQFYVIGDIGNLAAAVQSAEAFRDADPKICFLAGVAGSLDPAEARLGDVAVATSVKYFGPDKIKVIDPADEAFSDAPAGAAVIVDRRKRILDQSFFRYRRRVINFEQSSLALGRYMAYLAQTAMPLPLTALTVGGLPSLDPSFENPSPRIFRATMLASDWVIDSAEYVAFLQERNRDSPRDYHRLKSPAEYHQRNRWINSSIPVVDMESLGFFKMAEMLRSTQGIPRYFCVRGISDLSSHKERLDGGTKSEVRRVATLNALEVFLDMLEFFTREVVTAA
jgi:hypothetical protein